MSVTLWVAAFALGVAVLVLAGVVLARSGDEIAVRSGAGGLVVGAVLVAFATSLPEILTAMSAAIADAPDVAVGNLFGSSMANVAILAVVDLSHQGRVWPRVELGHARIGSVAIGLTALAAFGLLAPRGPAIGWVGWDTIVVGVAYLAALAWVRRSPDHQPVGPAGLLPSPTGWGVRSVRSRAVWLRFGGGAVLVLAAAPVVAVSAREIAAETGVDETLVGVVLVAISTSLPELLSSLAAVRIGAHDLAVGNLLGSNAANMAVLVLVDLAYTPGPLLGEVSATQSVAAVGAIVLMSLALAAIVHGEETALRRLEPDALLVLLTYLAVLGAVWSAGG